MEETTQALFQWQNPSAVTLEDVPGFLDRVKDKLYDVVTTYGMRLILAILLLIVGYKLVGWIIRAYKKSKVYARLDPTVRSFLKSVISITLKLLVIVSAAALMGVPMSSMIALVTSAGLTIGLALQGGLSNIAGGFVIMVFKPFAVGDYICFSQYEGTVKSISIFYTKIITLDNRQIMIPNSMVSNDALINNSAMHTRRVDLNFSVSYDSDLDQVRDVILRAAADDPDVRSEPAPAALLMKQDSSALVFCCRVFCKTEKYWDVYFRLNEAVKRAFDENGISIPYPQMDVHMK
ncbi:MAG: mechanosensitive ion channel family protein [Clostridia bacterium]|nr:mechanosensitive ion channel family protein [Clostridia bacterium]